MKKKDNTETKTEKTEYDKRTEPAIGIPIKAVKAPAAPAYAKVSC